MSRRQPRSSRPRRDPDEEQRALARDAAAWNVPGYLLAGLLVYGGIGWLLDRWLGTSWLVLVGILAGTATALYTIWIRYGSR